MADLDRARPLFDEAMPVQLRQSNRDEQAVLLSVRVIAGVRTPLHGARERLFRVEVTDEADECFLYTLDVTEQEYHGLKTDQELVVDFAHFPSHLIDLLRLAADGGNARFGAVLDGRGDAADALFSIVETNDFKHLTQLALRVRAGTDAMVKEYLGGRMRLLATSNAALLADLQQARALGEDRGDRLARCEARLADVEAAHQAELERVQVAHAAALNEQRQLAMDAAEEAAAAQSAAAAARQEAGEAEIAALRRRLEAAEARERELSDAKFAAETGLRDAEREGDSLRAALDRADAELQDLRSAHRDSEKGRLGTEKRGQEAALRVSLLEQQVRDKQEVVEATQQLLEGTEAAKAAAERSLEVYRANQAKQQERLDACIGEVHRGNDVIKRLLSTRSTLKGKVRDQQHILRRQERDIGQLEQQLQRAENAAELSRRDASARQDETRHLEQRLALANDELEKAVAELKQSQDVIRVLHRKQTEVQLGRAAAVPAPLTFRASSAPSVPGAPATTGAPSSAETTPKAQWASAFMTSAHSKGGAALGFGDDVADWAADPQSVLPLRS